MHTQKTHTRTLDMFNIVGYNLPPQAANHPKLDSTLAGSVASGHNTNNSSHLSFDERIYQSNLTKDDKIKHIRYLRQARNLRTNFNSLPVVVTNGTGINSSCNDGCRCKLPPPSTVATTLVQQVPSTNSIVVSSYNDVDGGNHDGHQFSILENLTPNDARILMLSEDELSRCGQFIRVFPSQTSHEYLSLFDKPRYSNLLLDAWERRYNQNRCEGKYNNSYVHIYIQYISVYYLIVMLSD